MTCHLCLHAPWLWGTVCDKQDICTLQCFPRNGSVCVCAGTCVCVWLVDCQMRFQYLVQCRTIWANHIIKVYVSEPGAFPRQCMCWLSVHFIVFTFHYVRPGRRPLLCHGERIGIYGLITPGFEYVTLLFLWCVHFRGILPLFCSPIEASLWPFWEVIL